MGMDFQEFVSDKELKLVEKLDAQNEISSGVADSEIGHPKSEHDIQALKACWEPKVSENLSERLPGKEKLLPLKHLLEKSI